MLASAIEQLLLGWDYLTDEQRHRLRQLADEIGQKDDNRS
jgi:hypothetical protein